MRSGPGTYYDIVRTMKNGDIGTMIDGPFVGSGYNWFLIYFGTYTGYAAY